MKRQIYFIDFKVARAHAYTAEDVTRLYIPLVEMPNGGEKPLFYVNTAGELCVNSQDGTTRPCANQHPDNVAQLVCLALRYCYERGVYFTPYLDEAIEAVLEEGCSDSDTKKIISELMAIHKTETGGEHFGMLPAERAGIF